jgi:hypothetical protein
VRHRSSPTYVVASIVIASLLLTTVPAVAQVEDEEVSAIKLDRVSVVGGGLAAKVSAGWEFEVTAEVLVIELGVWDADGDGLSASTPVKIWDAKGNVIASVEVPKGAEPALADSFRYAEVAPVKLLAGKRYVIAAQFTPNHKDGMVSPGGANVSMAAPLRWIASRRQLAEEFILPAAPGKAPADQPDLPGNFGANFRIASNKVARGVRSYYRTRYSELTRKTELIIVPEQADGSHRVDKYKTISLYALPDGKLTQVLFGDLPLGTGDDAYQQLAKQVTKLKAAKEADSPILRVVAMSSVAAADRQRAVTIMESGEFDASKPGRELREGEVSPLESMLKQPERDGKHVAADRFKDAGEYVEDRWTGLLWQKDGDDSGKMHYFDAFGYAAELELSGVRGWRLPMPEELATIFPATYVPFKETKYNGNECCAGPVEFASYWTSQLDPKLPDYAYLYQWYSRGGANNCLASKNFAYVRCVHNPLPAKK